MSERKEGVFRIETERLILDQYNPRLYGESEKESQVEIMTKIYQREDIDELASSLAYNGYFEEEPIIVIPFNPDEYDQITSANVNNFEYIVIEGNRRTTSVKLLLNNQGIVDSDYPKITSPEVANNLKAIPAIIYKNRDDVDTYLSVRHITGNRKWDAFAKAKYIFEKVNSLNTEINDLNKAIQLLSTRIGDKSKVVMKYYIYYKIFQEIEENVISYSSRNIKDRFSLIEVALSSGNTTISQYIGLPPFKNLEFKDPLIEAKDTEHLKDVTEWIFGKDEQGNGKIINDSREITQKLKPILGNQEATQHLKEYSDLEGAYQLTSGEEQMVIGNLRRANKQLATIITKVKKYKDNTDFQGALTELTDTLELLQKVIS